MQNVELEETVILAKMLVVDPASTINLKIIKICHYAMTPHISIEKKGSSLFKSCLCNKNTISQDIEFWWEGLFYSNSIRSESYLIKI